MWKGDKLVADTVEAASKGAEDTAQEIGAIADQQVPHDDGWLQDSKTIKKDPSDKLTVQIGYGGGYQSGRPEVPYAIKWHETPADFQKGRKHNYLRDPVKQEGAQSMRRNLKKRLSKVW